MDNSKPRKKGQMTQQAVDRFESLPSSALVDLNAAAAVSGRSRNSLYRHFKAGELTPVKIGFSTRIRVGELRTLMGVAK